MAVLYLVIGKSASGKDTIFQRLKRNDFLHLKTVIPYTTRPKREGEEDGREYYFLSCQEFLTMQRENKVIESRTYQTVHGDWTYFTADDGQIIMDGEDKYLLIGTLETYRKIREYYRKKLSIEKGKEWVEERIQEWLKQHIKPIYIEVENGLRLERALKREQEQELPEYTEMCRRFLADEEDFSEENLKHAGITKRFQNEILEVCLKEIEKDINK